MREKKLNRRVGLGEEREKKNYRGEKEGKRCGTRMDERGSAKKHREREKC